MKNWKIAAIVSGAVVGIAGMVGSVFAFLNHKKVKEEIPPVDQETDSEQADIIIMEKDTSEDDEGTQDQNEAQ